MGPEGGGGGFELARGGEGPGDEGVHFPGVGLAEEFLAKGVGEAGAEGAAAEGWGALAMEGGGDPGTAGGKAAQGGAVIEPEPEAGNGGVKGAVVFGAGDAGGGVPLAGWDGLFSDEGSQFL